MIRFPALAALLLLPVAAHADEAHAAKAAPAHVSSHAPAPASTHAAHARNGTASGAVRALKHGQARIDAILGHRKNETPKALRTSLKKAVNAFIDFDELARRALGHHWNEITPAQQKAFQKTMKALVEAAYLSRVKDRADYRVVYKGEGKADGDVVVHTLLVAKKTRLPIDYRLYKKHGRWFVFDVVTDGLSLLENYRSQFNQLIGKKGFDGLMQTLERKRQEIEKTADAGNG